MNFLEKEMTIDRRQDWDFLFWILILVLGVLIIYLLATGNLILILLISLIIIYIVKLTARNTKLAKNQMKKEKECQKSKAEIKVS